jgi:hypothetical protein
MEIKPTDGRPEPIEVVSLTKQWIEKAVIGLNLCPFARPVYQKNLIRYSVCISSVKKSIITELDAELQLLIESKPSEIETTLFILPNALKDFLEFNDFLDQVDAAITKLELDGIIQIASFHPKYQFAGRTKDDIRNYVNRSPFPMLHLLREDSIELAINGSEHIDSIFQNNMKTLRKLGIEGWKALREFIFHAFFDIQPALKKYFS